MTAKEFQDFVFNELKELIVISPIIKIIVIEYLPDMCSTNSYTKCNNSVYGTSEYCSDKCANNLELLNDINQTLWKISSKIVTGKWIQEDDEDSDRVYDIHRELYEFMFKGCKCGVSEFCIYANQPIMQQGNFCERCIELHEENHGKCTKESCVKLIKE